MNWGQKIAAKSISEIMAGPYDVTGVLAFKDGDRMDHAIAIKLISAFWHKVDRIFFGQAANQGFGINRRCFLEFGKSQRCIHVHFVAQSPFDPIAFSAILNVLWNGLNPQTAVLRKNWITPIHSKPAIAGYVTKEIWRFRDDLHVLDCDHGLDGLTRYAAFDPEARLQRIANRVDADTLEEAMALIPVHMIIIRKRMEEREREAAKQCNLRMASAPSSFRQFIQSRQT